MSDLTAGRLSVYLRCLTTLEAEGARAVSSRTLAERFHLNAAQIRKDLAYFGEFGVRGRVGVVPSFLGPAGITRTRVPPLDAKERVSLETALQA